MMSCLGKKFGQMILSLILMVRRYVEEPLFSLYFCALKLIFFLWHFFTRHIYTCAYSVFMPVCVPFSSVTVLSSQVLVCVNSTEICPFCYFFMLLCIYIKVLPQQALVFMSWDCMLLTFIWKCWASSHVLESETNHVFGLTFTSYDEGLNAVQHSIHHTSILLNY